MKSLPRQADLLRALQETLEVCALDVLELDHEDAHGQYEVDLVHDLVMRRTDHLMLFKMAAHAVAVQYGACLRDDAQAFRQPARQRHAHAYVLVDGGLRQRALLVHRT